MRHAPCDACCTLTLPVGQTPVVATNVRYPDASLYRITGVYQDRPSRIADQHEWRIHQEMIREPSFMPDEWATEAVAVIRRLVTFG